MPSLTYFIFTQKDLTHLGSCPSDVLQRFTTGDMYQSIRCSSTATILTLRLSVPYSLTSSTKTSQILTFTETMLTTNNPSELIPSPPELLLTICKAILTPLLNPASTETASKLETTAPMVQTNSDWRINCKRSRRVSNPSHKKRRLRSFNSSNQDELNRPVQQPFATIATVATESLLPNLEVQTFKFLSLSQSPSLSLADPNNHNTETLPQTLPNNQKQKTTTQIPTLTTQPQKTTTTQTQPMQTQSHQGSKQTRSHQGSKQARSHQVVNMHKS
jgi:hypothetical protein